MTLFIAVLPLRLSNPRQDFASMLSACMDNNNNNGSIKSMDCQSDIQRMAQLRYTISQTIVEKDAYDEGIQVLDDIHEYYNCLLECEARGIGQATTTTTTSSSSHQQQLHQSHRYHSSTSPAAAAATTAASTMELEWESALTGEIQVDTTLEYERANILWNLATLEAYQASKQSLNTKVGWSKAAQHFQNAASWLQHVPTSVIHLVDFSDVFLQFWQALCMAQSQRCIYESLACAKKPRHLLLAKLAAAAVPLFGEMETIIRNDEEEADNMAAAAAASTTASTEQQHSSHAGSGSGGILSQIAPGLVNNWADFSRAWGMYMSCKAEHHQAITSAEKKQWGQELARLDLALRFATLCCEFCERAPLIALQQLHTTVDATLKELSDRLSQAEHDNQTTHHQSVPHPNELPEIRGEKLVNIDQPLEKLLKPYQGQPMFQGVTNTQQLRGYVDLFYSDMDKLVYHLTGVAEERTDSARKALATVNLPHSLTAYRQEQAGGGIPDDLWQRVHTIQRERRIAKLKQDLWELRDVAEVARTTYQKIQSQLDFDLESDSLFRREHPAFEGHDAHEVQKSFRQSLANYDRLLVTAQEGDSVLLRRLEILDTNPKYKLLQFQKSQLDRLLPGAAGGNGNGGGGEPPIDTTHLSWLLVELSSLFHEREVLLNTIKEEVKNFDVEGAIQSRVSSSSPSASSPSAGGGGNDHEYQEALAFAEKSFDGLVFEIQTNIDKQTELVDAILAENEQFMMARERTSNSQSADSCIVMIEDAIEEIDQLSKHLKEGKDFYDVVMPKLEKLKQQVGDVSARLTVERLEYDDKANRSRQEEEDARMAKRMFDSTGSGNGNSGGGADPNGNNTPRAGLPGMSQIHHNEPQVFVDDEKVATLVAMEFDPAKVVAALTKYNNNVDQALNDLLAS